MKIDLNLHQQGFHPTTPSGKAVFRMMGTFANESPLYHPLPTYCCAATNRRLVPETDTHATIFQVKAAKDRKGR